MTKNEKLINAHPEPYEQGRRARLSGVDPTDAPHDASTDAYDAWKLGYDAAKGEAARNETSGGDDGPKAGDQLHMAADKNGAKAQK